MPANRAHGRARRGSRSRVRVAWALCVGIAFAGASRAPAETDVETFRIGLTAAPVTLDPRYATDVVSYRITRLIFDAPVDFDEARSPVPALTRWDVVTPRHYRFEIVGDPRFTGGARVTAADIAATYGSVIAEGSVSPHKGGLAHIERIDVIDADTLDFHLARPDPMFPGRLVIGVLPADATSTGRAARAPPPGSGPFTFEAWPTEQRLLLTRRRDGARFEFLTLKDMTVRVLKLARGEIDVLPDGIAFEYIDWMRREGGIEILDAGGTTFSYLGVNFEHPLTGDRRVREALALAIDRAAIVRHLFLGRARIGVSLLPPDHWSSDPTLEPYRYDPARAAALIAEVEAERGAPVELVYKTSANPFRLRLATILKDMFAEAGIDIEIRSYDWGTFYADVKAGRFELYSLSWVGLKLPDIYRYVFHSEAVPPGGANRGRYVDAEVDRLIDAAEATPTLAAQVPLWRQVQRQVHEDLAYIPLWYEDRVAAIRTGIRGFSLPPDGRWDALTHISKGPP